MALVLQGQRVLGEVLGEGAAQVAGERVVLRLVLIDTVGHWACLFVMGKVGLALSRSANSAGQGRCALEETEGGSSWLSTLDPRVYAMQDPRV
ncbi:hypothetical protein GCM10010515_76690 [Streptomyces fructofermentans]|uniref:Uncharacterized protein n=1 Tax=Streptomyces fructofermentans TaxID=152141 RepID=A0A918NV60_9ACTN|nr:hypothetical protein GCM10010515_76690 [Streptomyces fructofermentans]